MEIPIGSVVGGYRIKQQLGSGGMGAVYLAAHRSLPRDVALKVLHPGVAGQPDFRARFEREADLLSRLDHPGIVDVQDRGQDGDLLWMTMDYVAGPDLGEALAARGAFRPEAAVHLVTDVAAALDHAHDRGLLHRDVKPPNVLLKQDPGAGERAVLTDFGIAKDVAASAVLTGVGQAPATYAYAAPEQLLGRPLDRRVDVHALGAVLFELLTGRRAFPGADPLALLYAVTSGPVPDLRAVRPDVPPALAAVVTRALAKDPAERYATCGELAAAARGALAAPSSSAPPTTVDHVAPPRPPAASQPAGRSPGPGPGPGPGAPPGPGPAPWPEPVTRGITSVAPGRAPAAGQRRRAAVLVAATVALLVVVGALAILWSTGPDDGAAPPSAVSPTDGGADGGTDGGDAAVAGVAVGDCLDGSGSPAACDAAHAGEVVATSGDCTAGAALAYLGGAAGQDVLRGDVTVGPATVGEQQVCVLTGPGAPWAASNRDVLLGRDGDVWRRCGDEIGRELPCSEPHTTEVVAEVTGGEQLDCQARADAYLGKPFDQVADRLRVFGNGTSCVVEVRGDNVLTASLRRLGSAALPIEAAGD